MMQPSTQEQQQLSVTYVQYPPLAPGLSDALSPWTYPYDERRAGMARLPGSRPLHDISLTLACLP